MKIINPMIREWKFINFIYLQYTATPVVMYNTSQANSEKPVDHSPIRRSASLQTRPVTISTKVSHESSSANSLNVQFVPICRYVFR